MKKSTIGIIAVAVVLVGGGGGCIIHQYLQTPPTDLRAPAPSPEPTPAPTPAPAGTTVSINEKDDNTTLHVANGAVLDLVLHSTYWEIQPTDGSVLKPLAAEPTVTGTLSNPPGMGTGTVEMQYQVIQAGTTVITASRTTCGEALRCTGTQGEFKVTIVADETGAVAPSAPDAAGGTSTGMMPLNPEAMPPSQPTPPPPADATAPLTQ